MRIYEKITFLKNVFFILALVLADQFIKYEVRTSGGFYICNKNLAFGLPFLTIFTIIALIILLATMFNLKFKIFNLKSISNFKFQISNCPASQIIGLLLIISGGISNIFDRLFIGCVIDFIDSKFWPVFNLADIFITIGVIMIIYKNIAKRNQNFDL